VQGGATVLPLIWGTCASSPTAVAGRGPFSARRSSSGVTLNGYRARGSASVADAAAASLREVVACDRGRDGS
jgi:hypothetical protein